MKLFLDTSVLLAGAGSARGASRFVLEQAHAQEWALLTAQYCVEEAKRNISKLGARAVAAMEAIVMPALLITPTELAFDKALVFPKAKDRPVLLSALGCEADYLLTLDETDFQGAIGDRVYNLEVRSPGQFLSEMRMAGLI